MIYTLLEFGSRSISIHLYEYLFDTLTTCQEPDLNWWHEDFQSSALPAELSRPFLTHHTHLTRWLGSMSIKRTKKYLLFLYRLWNFLYKKKKRLCKSHFNTSNYMDCELFQWGFLSQRYSFIRVSYIWQDLWYGSACERVEWMRKITNFSSLTKKEDGINS